MNKLETALTALNVEISRYVIDTDNGETKGTDVVVTGGLEVIHRYPVKDFKEVNGDWEKIDIHGEGNERTLLPFRYVDVGYHIDHLEELIKLRSVKGLTKEETGKYEIEKKDDLESKIAYIHESNPSTNSLALAKQFKLEHHNIIKQIFKLAEQNPSILMGVKYEFYELVNNGQSPENQGSESSLPSNLGLSQYLPFLQITEEVYYKFVSSMGTPKSKRMKVYRQIKQEEYFEGFQRLREDMLAKGYEEKDIEQIIKIRTQRTNELQLAMYDYTQHNNNNSVDSNHLNIINVSKMIFNVVNDLAGIDAKNYHLKMKDRNAKDTTVQRDLEDFETRMTALLKSGKTKGLTLLQCIEYALDLTKEEIQKHLENKGAKSLSTLLK